MSGIDAVSHKAPDDDSGQPHCHKSCPVGGELLLLGELAALGLWDVGMWLQSQAQKLRNDTVSRFEKQTNQRLGFLQSCMLSGTATGTLLDCLKFSVPSTCHAPSDCQLHLISANLNRHRQ
jgi:hypothetical protein